MTTTKLISIIVIIGIFSLIFIISGCSSTYSTFKTEAPYILKDRPSSEGNMITQADLEHLPAPVQRYLSYTGVVGKERVHTVRLKQDGFIRLNPDGGWKSLKGEEYFNVDRTAFAWYGEASAAPLVKMGARDKYVDGSGNMLIKLTPFITLGNVSGPNMDQGALIRFFNEMMWFPAGFLNPEIKWETIDNNTVKATINDHGHSETCTIYFDDEGKLINFMANRYRDGDGLRKWSTPITKYGEFNGLRLPVEGEGVWHLEEGDFSYIRLAITDLEYNVDTMF